MTPDEQRIAIAEACGYKWTTDKDSCWCWLHPSGHFMGKRLFPSDKEMDIEALHDYPRDLNAMHDAVNSLDYEAKVQWADHLAEIVKFNHREKAVALAHHSADQSAEAFLKAKGLWK